jgi:hypothetical protein
VFGEIAASHKAIGAYEVLDKLAARGERLAPISVYRAIDALLAAGIVHRFESRNAVLRLPCGPRRAHAASGAELRELRSYRRGGLATRPSLRSTRPPHPPPSRRGRRGRGAGSVRRLHRAREEAAV